MALKEQIAKPFYKWNAKEIKESFRNLDRKTRLRILSGAAGALILIPFVLWPAWVGRWQNQLTIQQLRLKIDSARYQIQQEPKLREEEQAHESFVEEAQSHLFTESEIQRLLGLLTEMGQRSKVALLSSQPQPETAKIPESYQKKYQAQSYVIALEGGYHALATFVSEIENHSKILRVDEFSVSTREETPGTHVGEIRLSAFLKKE